MRKHCRPFRGFAGALLIAAAAVTSGHSTTFSDDNWISMGKFPGVNGYIRSSAVDGSGNLYVGGAFTMAGDVFANNIAKWDGTNWSALGSGINGVLFALAVSGGDLYAAGEFTLAGGVAANNIARWDGTNWSALGSGIPNRDSFVLALAVSGNDLYAGGRFTNAGGAMVNNIAKWNGSSWSGLGLGTDSAVLSLAVSGSDLYAGGSFTNAGGVTVHRIARWNGASWSPLGSGIGNGNARVTSLAISGSDLYAGGAFSVAGGVGATNIARWNGASWSALGSGTDLGTFDGGYASVNAVAVMGSDVYAGGGFTLAGGIVARRIARWNGSTWSAMDFGMDGEVADAVDPSVFVIAVSGTNLYAAGEFTTAGNVPAGSVARWVGERWSTLSSGMNSYVSAMASAEGEVYAAGFFSAGWTGSNYVAKWNGSNWSLLGSGVKSEAHFRPAVEALAVSGPNLYAGGFLTNAGGTPVNRIAKWDGHSWSPLGSGINGAVAALAVSGSDLYAAGQFTSAGGVAANNIAKWDGTNWSALGSGIGPWANGGPGSVSALAVVGSNLYAGGIFSAAGGTPANYIAKWDGATWSALGTGMGGSVSAGAYVNALAVLGTNLYAAGDFTTAGGITVRCVARWDGNTWSALGSGMIADDGEGNTPRVYALAVSGSDLYAGGRFTLAGGIDANYVARWDGRSWFSVGSGMNRDSRVRNLAASRTELFVAGAFATAGGKISRYLARARIGSAATSVAGVNTIRTIHFSGVTGYAYDVESATSLTPPITWTKVTSSSLYPAADGSFTFTDSNAPPAAAYYRSVVCTSDEAP